MTRDAIVGAVVGELRGGELPVVVDAEYSQLAPAGLLCLRLNALDGICGGQLGSQ